MKSETAKILFRVTGSRGDIYDVGFGRKGGGIVFLCSCPAGWYGSHCRHRFKLLSGDTSDLLSDNADQVVQLKAEISGTALERALAELRLTEAEAAAVAKRVKNLKAQIGRLMGGDPA